MRQYFEYDYSGPPFELWGTGHVISVSIIAAVLAFLIWGWKNPTEEGKRRARMILLAIFLVFELSWHAWNIANDAWTVQRHLPLHTCSISALACIYLLVKPNYRVYEIIYFLGIAGASQTLLTPEAGLYGLPHFRAVQTLGAHGLIVIIMVYMTTIEGMRPTWSSILRTMIFANLYMFFVTGINYALGSNYMYTLRKPDSASILDMLGPWPWYLFWAEFVALFLFALLYVPFAVKDWRAAAKMG